MRSAARPLRHAFSGRTGLPPERVDGPARSVPPFRMSEVLTTDENGEPVVRHRTVEGV